jgi:DNA-directed RNA polymerase specialized sigma24 family protein
MRHPMTTAEYEPAGRVAVPRRGQAASASSRSDVAALYDAHAHRLYPLALRILGDGEAACSTVADVFVAVSDGTVRQPSTSTAEAWLVRLTRDFALARQARFPISPVHEMGDVSPRQLVEEAFFGGHSIPELASAYSLTEEEVRTRLRDGMTTLRTQLDAGKTK